jgi:hypothetical protein
LWLASGLFANAAARSGLLNLGVPVSYAQLRDASELPFQW